ncbi:hypothetical protein TRIUR3_17124 [Triticum urartu]|uniref:Uncharacterized protein n=1 Tax=Triticum urartu TaxID=4572 RepID=M7ZWQ9_TRIUA|nr:hypothetical protein TRIUR3_17124 [Triticum urartu]
MTHLLIGCPFSCTLGHEVLLWIHGTTSSCCDMVASGLVQSLFSIVQDFCIFLEKEKYNRANIGLQQLYSTFFQELMNLKQLDEAENLRRKILHIMELSKTWSDLNKFDLGQTQNFNYFGMEGWDSFGTTVAAVQLSVTLVTLGKLRESEELLQRCLAVRKKILSEDHIQVASILVHLAKLSLLRIISDIKVNNDLCRSHLVRGKRLVNDSIRIAEKILNPSREDQKKPKNAFGIELERRIAATGILLEALEIVGLLDCLNMAIQEWAPAFDYENFEQALRKWVSLYNEPRTRNIVSNALRAHYMKCWRTLVGGTRRTPYMNAPHIQDLLAESQQIMKELGGENSMTGSVDFGDAEE